MGPALQDTWPCDALVAERVISMTEAETTLSIDDMLDIYEAIEERNRLQAAQRETE